MTEEPKGYKRDIGQIIVLASVIMGVAILFSFSPSDINVQDTEINLSVNVGTTNVSSYFNATDNIYLYSENNTVYFNDSALNITETDPIWTSEKSQYINTSNCKVYNQSIYPTFSVSGTDNDNPRTVTVQFKDCTGNNVPNYISWDGWVATTAHGMSSPAVQVADGGAGNIYEYVSDRLWIADSDSDGTSQISMNSGSTQTVYFHVSNPDGMTYVKSVTLTAIPP